MNAASQRFNALPTAAKWMVYALLGMLLLTIVQSIGGTDKLTSAPISREMLRWALPVLLAGLGGLFADRAGVVNIGLEGMMILGMWFGAWGALEFGPWIGMLIGIAGGGLGGLLHAVATVTFGVDQIISGVAINILAPAGTRYLSQEVWGSPTQSPRIQGIGDLDVPFLAGGSIFGWDSPDILLTIANWEWWFVSDVADFTRGLLRNTSLLALIAIALVPFCAWLLWRTRFGLRLRISGEQPQAGESQGVNIYAYKYAAVIISGALAGLGGVVISSPELSGQFLEGNSGGRGFIGLAAVIFGNWRPLGILLGALLYGYVFGLDLKDLDGSASHALLLLNSIALAGITVWAIVRRPIDAALSPFQANWKPFAVLVIALAYGFYLGNFLEDLDGGSYWPILLLTIVLIGAASWMIKEFRLYDAGLAGFMAVGALIWWRASETVPGWWSNILPYVVVLLVLVFFAQRLREPAAIGQAYRRGGN